MRRFVEAKKGEIERLLKNRDSLLETSVPPRESRPDFLSALKRGKEERGLGLICEYKRASPSLGDIELGVSPARAAQAYARADCLSVLTEEFYFKGKIDHLFEMGPKPLLRKDFIFHPLQLEETARTPAAAVLLIASLLPAGSESVNFFSLAETLGLQAVVEVTNPGELKTARTLGAGIVQVNARNLSTLKLDFGANLRFIKENPPRPDEFWIAASGIKTAEDLSRLIEAGYSAALVGTALMRGGNLKGRLDDLLNGLERLCPKRY
ncbi:MAG: indole-3-glycerol-phosphate synthase [Deltaproteobacteria bacterium]|jgi:indole-3-glycerol phosphate synthase|nr:indole-3-glycerol-phosphate synthase [Deltaproteobacteria bacterium]